MGVISAYFCGSLAALLIIIFVLTLLNRYQYTDMTRDKRYWNKKNFGGKYGKIPIPSCPGMMDDITAGMDAASQFASNAQKSVMTAGNRAANAAATATASAANAVATNTA
jgi:hypothetical protein